MTVMTDDITGNHKTIWLSLIEHVEVEISRLAWVTTIGVAQTCITYEYAIKVYPEGLLRNKTNDKREMMQEQTVRGRLKTEI